MGYNRIAKILNQEGAVSPNQNPRQTGPPSWGGSTIRSMIINRTYLGDRIYNRISNSRFKKVERRTRPTNDRNEWVVVPNAHPAIISKEIIYDANKTLQPSN